MIEFTLCYKIHLQEQDHYMKQRRIENLWSLGVRTFKENVIYCSTILQKITETLDKVVDGDRNRDINR